MAEIKLLTISWKQNNPYGGYVKGDIVTVFFDNTTNKYKVYKNGTNVTSGALIPALFTYANQTNLYYKEETLLQVLICVGTSRLKYSRQSGYPYLTYELLADHPTCTLGNVCDLEFNDLPTITNASGSTNSDGSITVNASSVNYSTLPIQYALNQDFVYGAGQSSGTFNNLRPGNYTIYAKTSNNCRASIIAKVGVNKSFGARYTLTFNNPTGDVHKTEILQRGYAGASTEVQAASEPTTYRLRGLS